MNMKDPKTSAMAAVIFVCAAALVLFRGGQESEKVSAFKAETSVVEEAALEDQSEIKTLKILDFWGKEKTITLPIKTVVVLDPGPILNIVSALKAVDKVVGVLDIVTDMKDQYPVLSSLPSMGNATAPDIEKIVRLQPDLVIALYWLLDGLEEKLEPEIPVIRLRPEAFDAYDDSVNQIAAIFGKEKEAQRYIDWYRGKVEMINQSLVGLSEEEKPRAFVFYGGEHGMSEGPPYGTFGTENNRSTSIDVAGGISISKELPGDWVTVDPEWVISKNPEIIVREVYPDVSGLEVIGYGAENADAIHALYERIMSGSALETCDAVKNKRVHLIFGGFLGREWFIGHHYLAKVFHPELVREIDPVAVHQEFLTEFLGSSYDVSEEGVFIYPRE